jgi:putative transposon-encoded protein
MATYMVDKRKKILEGAIVPMGNSGGIYVPKEWIGKTARVQIIEDEEKDGE